MESKNQNPPTATQLLQLVTFGVGDCQLAVGIEHVQEINRQLDVTPVPGAPHEIRGVINLRGDVVTVLNLHHLLGIREPARARSCRNLILNIAGERVGVLVDRVSDILAISPEEISRRPPNLNQVDRRFMRGVHIRSEGVVVILDPHSLANAVEPAHVG